MHRTTEDGLVIDQDGKRKNGDGTQPPREDPEPPPSDPPADPPKDPPPPPDTGG